jgi:heme oxygenase
MSTRQWHADVDDSWLQLLAPTVSRADYLAQLVRTYGFVAPFESACKYTPSLGRFVDFRQLLRAGLIAQDLLSLGLTPSQVAQVPHCERITTFVDVEEALGWLYVVERATLLQDGIRRHLLAHLPELGNAVSYLTAFDGRVNEHWESFGRMLDEAGNTPASADRIAEAANAGFQCVRQWFHHHTSAQATRIA